MSIVTEPTSISQLSEDSVFDRLLEEHDSWKKAQRSGDMSRQMRDARNRMNALLDELLLLKDSETPII